MILLCHNKFNLRRGESNPGLPRVTGGDINHYYIGSMLLEYKGEILQKFD